MGYSNTIDISQERKA